MKVLSIKEPFATLIANGTKKIETRSWKTNYRGELFIHASSVGVSYSKLRNQLVKNLSKNLKLNCGNIICKCNLIDCIYMDERFIKKIKQNTIEYSCGEYESGRYAWILDNVELIYPIPAKGKLNIWNFSGEYELISSAKDNH